MSSVDQARGGLMGAQVTGKPVWLALSVDDTDGTRLYGPPHPFPWACRSQDDACPIMPTTSP